MPPDVTEGRTTCAALEDAKKTIDEWLEDTIHIMRSYSLYGSENFGKTDGRVIAHQLTLLRVASEALKGILP